MAPLAAGAMAVAVAAPANAAPQTPTVSSVSPNPTSIPITGIGQGLSSFTGSFDLQRFVNQGGQLLAVGTFAGSLWLAADTWASSGQDVTVSAALRRLMAFFVLTVVLFGFFAARNLKATHQSGDPAA